MLSFSHMRHIIWRNRASAILGLLIMIIPFTGFPEPLRTALIVLFGLLIVIFGFARESTSGFSYNQEAAVEPTPDWELASETEMTARPRPMVAEEETVAITSESADESLANEELPEFVTEMNKVKKRQPRRKKSGLAGEGPKIEVTNFDAPEEDEKQ